MSQSHFLKYVRNHDYGTWIIQGNLIITVLTRHLGLLSGRKDLHVFGDVKINSGASSGDAQSSSLTPLSLKGFLSQRNLANGRHLCRVIFLLRRGDTARSVVAAEVASTLGCVVILIP